MVRVILNEDHLDEVLGQAFRSCRHRLFISTADVKNVHIPTRTLREGSSGRAIGLLGVLQKLSDRGVEISLLHASTPSGPLLEDLKRGIPENLQMRCCRRVHSKAVIVDGRWMYLGSANLTGAGLGAKSATRRNFESGICTNDVELIDPVLEMIEGVFSGKRCDQCDRKDFCPEPLEEPRGI